jgi:hypothetical protein
MTRRRDRREFPSPVKRAAWERCKDAAGVPRCEGCSAPLRPGHYRFDHDKPDAFDGEPTLENCKVKCDCCDFEKTYKQDLPAIAKSNRVTNSFIGAKRAHLRPMPFGRTDRLKQKMNGEIVWRADDQPFRRPRA